MRIICRKITPPPSAPPLKIKRGGRGVVISDEGFTLVELMITMVVFVLAMVAASNIFTALLTQFKQQSRIAESNIEGISGLEMMRHDLEQAGFGLPWSLGGNTVNYSEADSAVKYDPDNADSSIKTRVASDYNDNGNVPRAFIISKSDKQLMNGSAVLVIKATNIATTAASQKWEYIVNNGGYPNALRTWDGSTAEQIDPADHVIIINPAAGSNISNQRVLVSSGGSFDVQLNNSFSFPPSSNSGGYAPFEPPENSYTAYLVYGVSPGELRMPFNRADFFIKRTPDIPSRCAPGTGVLYKASVNQADGKRPELPLLDCVLDMQVVAGLDANGSGSANTWISNLDDPGNYSAQVIRDQLKEIRVYLVVQEGQKDTSYTSPATIDINDPNTTPQTIKTEDLNTLVGADYKYYRWKLHTIAITPYNLK